MKILYLPNEYSQQRQHEKKAKIYPVLMAMEAEWYKQQGHEVYWNYKKSNGVTMGDMEEEFVDKRITEAEGLPFLDLPHPDREFTRAKEYTSGNYKYLPGTHMQAADGCWHGKCTFCVENKKLYKVRPVEDVISEIQECVSMGFKEVFDDSGTFPSGEWLGKFCNLMCKTGLRKKVKIGINFRFGLLDQQICEFMKYSGFRMLLYGLESANQYTLDKINKGIDISKVEEELKVASKSGLEPHLACMFGYPWETDQDAENTLKFVWRMLRKGYAKTAQASFYSTPDGKCNENHRKYVKQIYNVGYDPRFWLTKLRDIKDVSDIKYLWKSIKAGLNK